MSTRKVLARFEGINRAAIRAFGAASSTHIQENLGVVVPHRHARFGAGAEHAALVVQVRRQEFDGAAGGFDVGWGCGCHGEFSQISLKVSKNPRHPLILSGCGWFSVFLALLLTLFPLLILPLFPNLLLSRLRPKQLPALQFAV